MARSNRKGDWGFPLPVSRENSENVATSLSSILRVLGESSDPFLNPSNFSNRISENINILIYFVKQLNHSEGRRILFFFDEVDFYYPNRFPPTQDRSTIVEEK